MEIIRQRRGEVVHIELAGRLDGYWCDHLNAALTEVLRDGDHHIRIDCSQLSYLTSAGIGVLMRFHKELGRISGTFHVVNPSPPVSTVLRITRVDQYLVAAAGEVAPAPIRQRAARRLEYQDVGLDVFDLEAQSALNWRAIGSPAPLIAGAFQEEHCTSFETIAPTLAVGIGAFGDSFSECRVRFGELLSVAGATAYQPGDGTNVADYLVSAGGNLGADVRVLYCLACEGDFSHLVRFEPLQPGGAVPLSRLLAGCFEAAGGNSLGFVMVAEASGLVGAALRRSPTERLDSGGFFSHPAVRARLSFSVERAYARSLALVAGVVTRDGAGDRRHEEQLRPIGPGLAGHFHAAAFRFRPLRKGPIDLTDTVTGLFEPEQLLGVLHLLHDDRAIAGAGESDFFRGACWIGRIAGPLPAA
jgi:anti-anti-sigma factor